MAGSDKEEVPMLLDSMSQFSDDALGREPRKFNARSASMSISMGSVRHYESEDALVSHTGPLRSERRTPFVPFSGPIHRNRKFDNFVIPMPDLVGGRTPGVTREEFSFGEGMVDKDHGDNEFGGKNEHLLKSGPLGVCNDPYCTTCPTYYNYKATNRKGSKASALFETKIHNALYGDAKGWARRSFSYLSSYIPGIMNPHAKDVQRWNKFFVISCLVAIFIDPLFFFLLSVQQNYKCIVLNWSLATAIAVVRSMTDFIYLLHMMLQFRLAYVAPESRVIGAGDLVDNPKKIALHYLYSYFLVDLFVVLPLPQIMILLVLPRYLGTSGANFAKNFLRVSVLIQYIPRIFRFLPLLAGQSASGFIFESAWANFVINLLIFVLVGHVVGSMWYLFGLQRINKCLEDACVDSQMKECAMYMDCGEGNRIANFKNMTSWPLWTNNTNATGCFDTSGATFNYGIYESAVPITTESSIITRYIYSLFWGFQQISTLAGNQTPSSFIWEILFTMGIIGLGLLLFALLIGNMQNFLQALGRRRLEMQLRRRDVEQWMSHRRLPAGVRRRVRQSERFNWAATRGVNEEELLENLPEDLQREIRRHLFKFIKKVRIFTLMEEPILDAICESLRQTLYIEGSRILTKGAPIDKMVFIVRGKLENNGADGNVAPLSEGDVCGEELLTWCLDHNRDGRKINLAGQRLISNRTVKCLSNVEAFSLRAADLEEVTYYFARFLRNPRVQGAIRYESPYWRAKAAVCIQVTWRYRKKRLNRTQTERNT